MSRQVVWVGVLGLLAVSATACGLFERQHDLPAYDPALYAGLQSPAPVPTPPLAWANGSAYAIVVRKSERTLTLYHAGEQQKVYPIVLGIDPAGPKTYQGDLRTPEGLYYIVRKWAHQRWSRFMLLSYPNQVDRRRYAMAMTEGRVPIIDGQAPGLGGAVGIHGSDREDSNVRGIDWTWGCISMLNAHVAELYDLAPVGTPVLIEE